MNIMHIIHIIHINHIGIQNLVDNIKVEHDLHMV
jgi:hypothetical protein